MCAGLATSCPPFLAALNEYRIMNEIVTWIESHPISIDIVKWLALIALAWFAGVFRFLKSYSKRPSLSIVSEASLCFLEKMDSFQGCNNVSRAAYMIDLTIRNPTSERIVIESFFMSYVIDKPLRFLSHTYHPVSMPSRPRKEMGSSTKVSKVFFFKF